MYRSSRKPFKAASPEHLASLFAIIGIMVFIVGDVRPFHPSEVKHVSSFEDMKGIANGDIVETFGHVLEWDHDCVPIEVCERLASSHLNRQL